MKKNKHGFTLAELLIVVTIIAVLVGISIPVFTSQLEKARESKDAANIRSEYAKLMAEVTSNNKESNYWDPDQELWISNNVVLSQTTKDWQNETIEESLSNIGKLSGEPANKVLVHIEYKENNDEPITIIFGEGYIDSKEIQDKKTNTQNLATKTLEQLRGILTTQAAAYGGDIKSYLDSLNPNSARYNLTIEGRTVTCWYKKDSNLIDSMDQVASTNNKSWANFTLDTDGNVIIFNYVDPDYSYSSYDVSKENTTWIGSAVIK